MSSAADQERRAIDLTSTLEQVSVPAAIVDREGIVTWLNNAAREVFGSRVGQPFVSVVAPEYAELVQRQLKRKLRGEPMTDYEVELFSGDGRRRRAEISSVVIPGRCVQGRVRRGGLGPTTACWCRSGASHPPPERGPAVARPGRLNRGHRRHVPPEQGDGAEPRASCPTRARGALAPRGGGAGTRAGAPDNPFV
jgi:PAS domain S-box-containing protein